jgi:chlorobactene glucosyltransferase
LTADADVVFSPETLKTAIRYAEKFNFDALTLMPKQVSKSFWEEFFIPVFYWFGLLMRPFHQVNNPKLKTFCGVGNFFLLRRNVLEKIGTFEAVKNEVAEDLKLAQIIKKKGFILRIEYAPNLLETRMYKSFSEIWEGFTKNFFSGMNQSLLKTINGGFWMLLLGVLPFFMAIWSLFAGKIQLFLPLFFAYILQVLTMVILRFYLRLKIQYAFLVPIGFTMFLAILANSTVKNLSRKGVTWKERAIFGKGRIPPNISK